MKKYFTLFFVMLLSMMAMAEESVFYTMTTPKATGNNAYATYYDVTINDMSWNAPGNQSFDGYWRIGGKSLNKVDRFITANDAMGSAISKVVLNHNGVSNSSLSINSIKLTIATDKQFSNVVETISKSLSDKTVTFEPTSTEWATGAYYKLTINCTNSKTSNYGLDITSLVFYTNDGEGGGAEEKTLVSIAASGTAADLWTADAFTHQGVTITATWSDDSQKDVTSACAFSGYDMTTAGTQTVTATYQGQTCTYSVKVNTIANTQETAYTVAEAIDLIDAGNGLKQEVFVKGIISEIPTAWSDDYKNITYNISDDGETTGQQFQLFRCATNGGEVGDAVVAKGTMTLYTSTSTYEFTAGNTIVDIVKAEGGKTTATIEATYAENLTVGDEDEYSVTYNGDGELEVASSDETVAEAIIVDGTVLVEAIAAGTTTITISAPETENYKAATLTYTLTVNAAPHALTPAAEGYENVDFTTMEPYASLAKNGSATVEDYQGTSFTLAFAKPQSSTTPTKFYQNGNAVRAYTNNTITVTAAEPIKYVDIAWVSGYVDGDVKITGLGTTTAVVTFSKTCRFTDITVYYKTYKRDVVEGSYGTICLPFAVSAPQGATFYSVKGITANEVNLTEVSSLDAGVAYVFKAATNKISCTYTGEEFTSSSTGSCLTGVFKATAAPVGSYVLQNQEGVVGFYKVDSVVPTVGAYRAYLTVASGARVLTFGDETAISTVKADNANEVIYNMAGQRVSKAEKGLFIINGKKVIR